MKFASVMQLMTMKSVRSTTAQHRREHTRFERGTDENTNVCKIGYGDRLTERVEIAEQQEKTGTTAKGNWQIWRTRWLRKENNVHLRYIY